MAAIILPHRLRRQPQGATAINWGNPITRGLEFVWLGSDPKRIFSAGKAAYTSMTLTRDVTQSGVAGAGNVSNGPLANLQLARSAIFQSNQWTGVCYFEVPVGTTSALFESADSPGASTNDRSLGIDSSGQLSAYLYDGSGKTATDTVAIFANTPCVAAAASSGTTIEVWRNGVRAASTATSNGGFTGYTAPGPIFVGAYGFGQATAGAGSNARIGMYAYWTRYLSAAEHMMLADDPYCLFVRSAQLWMNTVAAPPPSSARPRVFVCM